MLLPLLLNIFGESSAPVAATPVDSGAGAGWKKIPRPIFQREFPKLERVSNEEVREVVTEVLEDIGDLEQQVSLTLAETRLLEKSLLVVKEAVDRRRAENAKAKVKDKIRRIIALDKAGLREQKVKEQAFIRQRRIRDDEEAVRLLLAVL